MDFEAKIQWKPGMALTASALRHRDEDFDEGMRALRQVALGTGRIGLVPGYEYFAYGAFSGRNYELVGLNFTALLPSGRIFHICEDLKMEIPKLNDGDYFLSVGETGRIHEFEMDDVPYTRPEYDLFLKERSEIEGKDLFPVKHFIVSDGVLSVDEDYIPPTLMVYQNESFVNYQKKFEDVLSVLCRHEKMTEGDFRRSLSQLSSRLYSLHDNRSVFKFIEQIEDIVGCLDFYIGEGLSKTVEQMPEEYIELKADFRRKPFYIDINSYLQWVEAYLNAQVLVMDRVVLVDNSIDYEQLKNAITAELQEKLSTEIASRVYEELHDRLTEEISGTVTETVERFIEENLHPQIREFLGNELHDSLYPELYDSLYAELSKLEYRPAKVEEDVFVPLI